MLTARGFSLIELMIAVTLGMIAVAGVACVFMVASRSYKQDDKVAKMQDNLRFAIAQIVEDVEMAGFFAQIRDPQANIDVDASSTAGGYADCGPSGSSAWTFGDRTPIETVGNATAAQANAAFGCIGTAEFVPGTDVLAIKRLLGGSFIPGASDDGRIVLRTDGTMGTLFAFDHASAGPAPAGVPGASLGSGTVDVYEYKPAIWYVRKYPAAASAPLPSLCRKVLGGNQWTTECVAEGIENLQLECGLDANGDGAPDYFVSYNHAPPPADAARIVAMRITLLARAAESDPFYRNAKAYALGNATVNPPSDGFYRRALTTTVLLRNPDNMARPYALPE